MLFATVNQKDLVTINMGIYNIVVLNDTKVWIVRLKNQNNFFSSRPNFIALHSDLPHTGESHAQLDLPLDYQPLQNQVLHPSIIFHLYRVQLHQPKKRSLDFLHPHSPATSSSSWGETPKMFPGPLRDTVSPASFQRPPHLSPCNTEELQLYTTIMPSTISNAF